MNESARSSRDITISGELTIYTASEWRDRLIGEMAGTDDIRLQLAEVAEIDSAGLQLLLAAKRLANGEGRQLELANPSAAVRGLFDLVRLNEQLGSDALHQESEAGQ
ncbi:lipid asymmetry maintenance protein MlaB [Azonexus sp. R2A61]|uniref:STAS domain-containing protein n=1 Tax=Azonexus sp. R2A61 TaxID=2744443 RepID=UPI001F21FFD2|nr:STAS domain-containing protein [Azonexus sp. R2A61]